MWVISGNEIEVDKVKSQKNTVILKKQAFKLAFLAFKAKFQFFF